MKGRGNRLVTHSFRRRLTDSVRLSLFCPCPLVIHCLSVCLSVYLYLYVCVLSVWLSVSGRWRVCVFAFVCACVLAMEMTERGGSAQATFFAEPARRQPTFSLSSHGLT